MPDCSSKSGTGEAPKTPKQSRPSFDRLNCFAAMFLIVGCLHDASAQTAPPAPAVATAPAPASAKPSRLKLTADRLKEMKARWSANRPKLAACRKDVKSKGLVGDDRWFYIEDCMGKT